LGHGRKNKAKSAKAIAASVRVRAERKAQRLAMQESGETGVRSIADLQDAASSLTSDLREGVELTPNTYIEYTVYVPVIVTLQPMHIHSQACLMMMNQSWFDLILKPQNSNRCAYVYNFAHTHTHPGYICMKQCF
jgi:hypothetical protein